jgi:hypothetical protein
MKTSIRSISLGTVLLLAAGGAAVPARADVWTGEPSANCIPAAADYNGDGATDLALFCDGAWHFYNPDGTYLKGIWTGGVAGDIPVPADYNGDGIDDVAVYRGGAWLFFDYATGAATTSVWTGSGPGSIPLPMDYNGDGKADFTAYLGGAWHFFNADGSYNKGVWTGGAIGDVPVPGDYDGDGTDDIVVFRRDDSLTGGGAWLFYSFSTGALTKGVFTGATSFNGDPLQPAPMDVNGDGKLEFTILAGGPWHFYNDDGTYRAGAWTGGVAGDQPVSRRLLTAGHP